MCSRDNASEPHSDPQAGRVTIVCDVLVELRGQTIIASALSGVIMACDTMRDPTTHEKLSPGAIALKPFL
jgi:hypothetical protein